MKKMKPYELKELSRNALKQFRQCPRCFYLHRRLKIPQPGCPQFTLNSAVDELVKREFDYYAELDLPHPWMIQFGAKLGVEMKPFNHPKLAAWQKSQGHDAGMRYLHQPTGLTIFGAPDYTLLVRKPGEMWHIAISDTKSTSSEEKKDMRQSEFWWENREQVEEYVWLLERIDPGYPVWQTAYFIRLNGNKKASRFNNRLLFDAEIVSHECDTSWVESAIIAAAECLKSDALPESNPNCKFCLYRKAAKEAEKAVTE